MDDVTRRYQGSALLMKLFPDETNTCQALIRTDVFLLYVYNFVNYIKESYTLVYSTCV